MRNNINKYSYQMLLIGSLIFLAAGMVLAGWPYRNMSKIVINEINANNDTVMVGDTRVDYIELYNPTSTPVNLRFLYLSDDVNNYKKLSLENYHIDPYGYNVVWLETEKLGLNKLGETVILTTARGAVIDKVSYPMLSADLSYARIEDENGKVDWEIRKATPGYDNDYQIQIVDEPIFSKPSGIYEDEIQLEIESPEDTMVYYTTDGSEPTIDSLRYSGTIKVYDPSDEPNRYKSLQRVTMNWKDYNPSQVPVNKAFIVRAIAIAQDGSKSKVKTGVYFIGEKWKEYTRPIISIVVDSEEMFGKNGIYMTGEAYDTVYLAGGDTSEIQMRYQEDIEIPANLLYLDGKTTYLNQDIGIKIYGASSRHSIEKRFSLNAREGYDGSNYFNIPLWGADHHKLALRFGKKNVMLPELMKNRTVMSLESMPVTVFINGEEWCETYLTEKYDTVLLASRLDTKKENIELIKSSEFYNVSREEWEKLYDYIEEHDLSNDDYYREFSEMMDIQNFIDFACFNVYVGNDDVSEIKNSVRWRTKTCEDNEFKDGKWRWGLFDLDIAVLATGNDENGDVIPGYQVNTYKKNYYGKALHEWSFFVALKKNNEFRKKFAITMTDLINTNFRQENVSKVLEKNGENIHFENDYFIYRSKYMLKYTAEELGISADTCNVYLEANNDLGDKISLNTITIDLDKDQWEGVYFSAYPIQLSIDKDTENKFVNWEITIDGNATEIIESSSFELDLRNHNDVRIKLNVKEK